ncbi:RNA polymerase sigma factor [Magnetospirillum sp. LM-5]|nr:RNA polymerase sigma factor [Magnetospirillum sp. LM-5]
MAPRAVAAVADECFAAHRATVRGVLVRLLKDEALAEDLTQEALLRATRAGQGWRGEARPATWLTAIALNLARDHWRTQARRPVLAGLDQAEELASDDRVEESLLEAEMSACILSHIARLPERARQAVLAHHFAGLGHAEIAALLECSPANARVILHRGLAALKASLEADCRLDFADPVPCERCERD